MKRITRIKRSDGSEEEIVTTNKGCAYYVLRVFAAIFVVGTFGLHPWLLVVVGLVVAFAIALSRMEKKPDAE